MNPLLKIMREGAHSPIYNYGGIPGVTSWLIGERSPIGIMRLLECSRDHREPIIPHSHRFDFVCIVLEGSVQHLVWKKVSDDVQDADEYQTTEMLYLGTPGQYQRKIVSVDKWKAEETFYNVGAVYSLRSDDVHSIYFGRGTKVLFFEGPPLSDSNVILEPFVDGEVVPTFHVPSWAFRRPA